MWMQDDSGYEMDWQAALAYADGFEYAGYTDWRLPNVKELQSIVDYSGVFSAIDTTFFNITVITKEAGNADYPYFWTGTSGGLFDEGKAYYAWYVAFGYAVDHDANDIHGAGGVRFDTKYEGGALGEGGERYYNYVRSANDYLLRTAGYGQDPFCPRDCSTAAMVVYRGESQRSVNRRRRLHGSQIEKPF